MNPDPFILETNDMTEPHITHTESNETVDGTVTSVTVSITVSAKPLGVDAFIKMEETRAIPNGSAGEAVIVRDEIISILRDQIIHSAIETAAEVRTAVAATPRGAVSVTPASPAPVAAGTQAGTQAPAFGAQATVAVANGAAPADTSAWMSVPSRFGDGEIRFLPTHVYSSQQLDDEVGAWLVRNGLNAAAFKVWDNRPGPKGLEAGAPNGCVATVKISKDAAEFVSPEIAGTAIARVKFNANGSLYVWFTKEAEAAIKFGALDRVKVA
jgi:hypothetical protein